MTWNLQATAAQATAYNPVHAHCAFVDESGDGRTSVDSGHWHQIAGRRILPDMRDGHAHEVLPTACQSAPMELSGQGGAPAQAAGCAPCMKNRR